MLREPRPARRGWSSRPRPTSGRQYPLPGDIRLERHAAGVHSAGRGRWRPLRRASRLPNHRWPAVASVQSYDTIVRPSFCSYHECCVLGVIRVGVVGAEGVGACGSGRVPSLDLLVCLLSHQYASARCASGDSPGRAQKISLFDPYGGLSSSGSLAAGVQECAS